MITAAETLPEQPTRSIFRRAAMALMAFTCEAVAGSPSNPEASSIARAAINGQQVRDLMTFHAVNVASDDTVKEALDLLVANKVAALPVVDDANRRSPDSRSEGGLV